VENGMRTLLTELATLLQQEIDRYRHLLTLVRRERRGIVHGELAGLVGVVRKKEAATRDLEQVEAARVCLLQRIAIVSGRGEESLTLARVIEMAPEDLKGTLADLLAEFRGVVGLLIAANDINRELLDKSLEFVHGSLALFHTVGANPPTYGAGGRISEARRPLAVVNQSV
jgi:flagellar biosynthesis/type III secretory pathway chaperone